MYVCGTCDATFTTRDEREAHQDNAGHGVRRRFGDRPQATTSGKFVTVDNGFGGTTTVRAAQPVRSRPPGSPSEKATKFLRDLLAEREGVEAAEVIRHRLNGHRAGGGLTRQVVSQAIDDLKRIPRKVVIPAGQLRTVEEHGRVTIDKAALPVPARGVLRFAVMSDTRDLTFLAIKYRDDDIIVCQEIGGRGDEYIGRQNAGQCYRGRLANLIAKVLADPREAMLTYGREIGRCGHCGTTLTNKASRDAGIGPVCASKGG